MSILFVTINTSSIYAIAIPNPVFPFSLFVLNFINFPLYIINSVSELLFVFIVKIKTSFLVFMVP